MNETTTTTHPASWKNEIIPVIVLSAAFFYLMLAWEVLIAIVLVIPVVIAAFIFGTTRLWWITIGLVPLSVNTELFVNSPIGMYVPTEPILMCFLILSILFFIKHPVEKQFLYHPISVMIILYFGWMLVTVMASSDIGVSVKNFTAQMWFVIPVLFLGSRILKKRSNRIRFFHVYLAGFAIVVIYTFGRLWSHGFPGKEAEWLMRPFFKDHTLLGAVLGLVLPYIYLRCFSPSEPGTKRIMWVIAALIFTFILIFTFSRAALLSLAVAGLFYIILLLRIPFQYLLGTGIVVAGVLLWNQDTLMKRLSSNQTSSSTEVVENIKSISNVTTDASNLERINRWNSAIQMWQERPLFGWGPGTYQFVYAPFQKSTDMTYISTNFGDVGNAHSEFLSALSESGWPAFILLVIWVLLIIGTAYRRVWQLEGHDRLVLIAAMLGVVAYFTHGVLNNFLNSDKVSVLIWGFTAIIIHYDIDSKSNDTDENE